MATIDFSDPCAAATELRIVLNKAMIEGQIEEIEFSAGNGSQRRLRRKYASIEQLKAHISELDRQCTLKTTGRAGRFGLRAGGM
jgi:hypothetical protein